VTGRGDCPSEADSCDGETQTPCGDTSICRCLRSTEGETRCGAVAHEFFGFCGVCANSAACVEQFPDFPDLFCVRGSADDDDVCCGGKAGFCALPCSFFQSEQGAFTRRAGR
jgi:hypothetical protein